MSLKFLLYPYSTLKSQSKRLRKGRLTTLEGLRAQTTDHDIMKQDPNLFPYNPTKTALMTPTSAALTPSPQATSPDAPSAAAPLLLVVDRLRLYSVIASDPPQISLLFPTQAYEQALSFNFVE